ncbi:MAG: NPCBM/NEW2 domain-containing protein [Planctomycetaceae bacterium]|jgi:hypothetical protein|nr:NPCBM/NEW2 domain-containing protein [Planctomycetaceae bacterium]
MLRIAAVLFVLFIGTVNAEPFKPVDSGVVKADAKAITLTADITGVNDLYLAVNYGGDSYDSDQSIWAEPVLYDKDGNATKLTDLRIADSITGWGMPIVNKNHQGKPLSIAGTEYEFGIWAHAPSQLHYKLTADTAGGSQFVKFETKAGLDSGSGRGTVTFHIRNTPFKLPGKEEYTKNYKPAETLQAPPPVIPPVNEVKFELNEGAAQKLLDKGIDELLFIRRSTFTSNHVYTDFINSRWTPGGGICAVNLKTGAVREITEQVSSLTNGVVNWFDLSFDAAKIVFDFKKSNDEGYRIYEINVDGTGLKQLTFSPESEAELVKNYRRGYHHGTDDIHPCYLPDGGIAFVSTRCQFSVLCDSSDCFTTKNLYRMNGDGSGLHPLTVSPLSEATPTVMHDGRILYHRWEYVDKAAGNCKALWAMNPDGTGSAEVYGNTITFPETKIQARVIPNEPNKIVFLGSSHWINNALGSVIVVDTAKQLRSESSMSFITDDVRALAHDGFHFKDENGKYVYNKDGVPGRLFRNPYPLSSELFIASMKPKGLPWDDLKGYQLVLLDGKGNDIPLLKDPTVSLWEAYPLVARTKPPVPTGMPIDSKLAEEGLARCVVTDVYAGMDNVKRGEIKYLRILEQLPRPWAARADGNTNGMAHSAVGDGFLSPKVQHGIVPVEEDGSANFVVPADKAVYFQALDKDFCAVQTERTYVNYKPGETRSCIGCHETPDRTPPKNTNTLKALTRSYSVPAAQPFSPVFGENGGKMTFDYARQIQPIWDEKCVECHNGEKAKLDLRGEDSGVFSVSYNNLVQLDRKYQLLGNRKLRNEDAASLSIEYIPPYQTGALSSPLAAWLCGTSFNRAAMPPLLIEAHKDVKLSDAEKLTLTNWLDVSAPFYPSYWGKKNVKFKDAPDYRPALTFEEVRSLTPKQ